MKNLVLRRNRTRFTAQFLLAALLCWPDAAQATLGKAEEEVEQDRVALHLEKTKTEIIRGYRRTTLSAKDLGVKEYIDPATKAVFGVAWSGSRMPDVMLLLGFDPAAIHGKGVFRSLRYTRIQTDSVLVELFGRMGAYYGRAVRFDLLPPGVSASEVVP